MVPSPTLSTDEVSIWFGVSYILFFLFTTFTQIPYDALAPEHVVQFSPFFLVTASARFSTLFNVVVVCWQWCCCCE
jgi:hypothetical protein